MKIGKLLIASMVLIAALVMLVGSGCASKTAEEKVVKVAGIWAMSGGGAPWGILSQAGAEIAVEDINAAGGINVKGDSYTVELLIYDHEYDPGIAATIARKAIYDDGVKVITLWDTAHIKAINDLAQKEKIIVIGTSGGGAEEFIGPQYPFTFNAFYDRRDNMDVLLEYASQRRPTMKNLVGVYPDDDEGYNVAELLSELGPKYGFTNNTSVFVDPEATDLYPVLTGVIAKGADIIDTSAIVPPQRGLIIKQAQELGFGGIFISGGMIEFGTVAEITGWGALEGAIGAGEFVELPSERGKSFQQRLMQRTGGATETWPAYHYDSLWLLKLAMEKANTLDTEKIAEAMTTVVFEEGAMGPARYSGMDRFGIDHMLMGKVPITELVNGEMKLMYFEYPSYLR